MENKDIARHIAFSSTIGRVESDGTIFLANEEEPFDPYIVLDSIIGLLYPTWLRILLLILPYILLLSFPSFNWIKGAALERKYILVGSALLIIMLPLKSAWVTFTTLILLSFALAKYIKERRFQIGAVQIALIGFFMVPLLFLGDGDYTKLAIPLGFIWFAIIGACLDFSAIKQEIKVVYLKVFLILISIILVNWLLFIGFDAYFFQTDFFNYFREIKVHSHEMLFWLYFSHPTFLSFFIMIGGIFCLDVYYKASISAYFAMVYAILALLALVVLGSRFTILMGFCILIWYWMPLRYFKWLLIPFWLLLFGAIWKYIHYFDAQREKLWAWSWSAILEKPWFGHGTGTSALILPEQLNVERVGTGVLMSINHSHNQILAYLLENGILGTTLFMIAFLYLIYHFAKQNDRTMLLIGSILLLLMLVEAPFRTATPLYATAFLLTVMGDNGLNAMRQGHK
ncbi:MAG: O-antigen ligase domain-containing protein [Flavobacteriales bacterium]|nr:MAG: O-antigen ligase domain-containing protein [Flavobacteriales bacterium]